MPMLVTQAIFGINVAVFIGMLLSGASPMESFRGEPAGVGRKLRALHTDGPVVEACHLLFCAHRHHSHCV